VTELVKSRPAISSRLPDFVEPMNAKLVGSTPSGDWIYEIKIRRLPRFCAATAEAKSFLKFAISCFDQPLDPEDDFGETPES
jgi:hypothetical protein